MHTNTYMHPYNNTCIRMLMHATYKHTDEHTDAMHLSVHGCMKANTRKQRQSYLAKKSLAGPADLVADAVAEGTTGRERDLDSDADEVRLREGVREVVILGDVAAVGPVMMIFSTPVAPPYPSTWMA